jgi:hypothetical protein
MKYLLALIILFIAVPINAQWVSFDLKDIENDKFEEQINPFIKSISLSTTRHLYSPVNINNRLRLGFAYSHGINISGKDDISKLIGGYPNFVGELLISENLELKGNISIFNSGNDIVQSFAYGFGLNVTNKESNNWIVSVLFSQLKGTDDISMKTIDGNIIYDFRINEFPIFLGFGINSYNSKILIDNELIPNSIKGNANNLLVGTIFNMGRINIMPILQLNSDIIIMSLEISGTFK